MNRHNYDYYLIILIDGHEELIGITYKEHIFLWLLINDYTAVQAAAQMRMGTGGDEYYSAKLRERFHVSKTPCMTAMFIEAYPNRVDEKGRRIEGMEGE